MDDHTYDDETFNSTKDVEPKHNSSQVTLEEFKAFSGIDIDVALDNMTLIVLGAMRSVKCQSDPETIQRLDEIYETIASIGDDIDLS